MKLLWERWGFGGCKQYFSSFPTNRFILIDLQPISCIELHGEGPEPNLMFCCHCFEIFSKFLTRGPHFHFVHWTPVNCVAHPANESIAKTRENLTAIYITDQGQVQSHPQWVKNTFLNEVLKKHTHMQMHYITVFIFIQNYFPQEILCDIDAPVRLTMQRRHSSTA